MVPNRMVWPSGSDCATPCVAINPFAPGRFSTTTGWPSRSDIFGAISRARMSIPPPGGKPMTIRIGRDGKPGLRKARWRAAAGPRPRRAQKRAVSSNEPRHSSRAYQRRRRRHCHFPHVGITRRLGSRPGPDNAGEGGAAWQTPHTAREVHVYAGTGGHSAWFSDDAGATWVHPNSHSGMYLEARVWSIASHPATPERLFAGSDMGVFRWDEPTARWTHLPSPMQDVWAVAVDPANPDVLIAGTRPAGFFRSTDAGRSWTPLKVDGVIPASDVNAGPTRVTQILFDPVDDGTVWATVEVGGIYRSKDRGADLGVQGQGSRLRRRPRASRW